MLIWYNLLHHYILFSIHQSVNVEDNLNTIPRGAKVEKYEHNSVAYLVWLTLVMMLATLSISVVHTGPQSLVIQSQTKYSHFTDPYYVCVYWSLTQSTTASYWCGAQLKLFVHWWYCFWSAGNMHSQLLWSIWCSSFMFCRICEGVFTNDKILWTFYGDILVKRWKELSTWFNTMVLLI